jgi:thioesterase domain-containing protein/acyl carrier protein
MVMGSNTIERQWPEVEAATQRLRRDDLGLSTPFEEPKTEFEHELTSIWEDVLGVDEIGTSDDFFELGGDSFAATTLAAEIEARLGLRFTPSDIINLSTVAAQAEMIAAKARALAPQLPPHLILSRAGGSQPPVFIIHGGLGFIFFKPEFLDEVGQDRPVYLFQAPGLDGRAAPLGRIEELASLYVESLRCVQPAGPYNIVALCAGSFIALEMCNQIEEMGDAVARLILLDPPAAPPAIRDRRADAKAKRSEARQRAIAVLRQPWKLFGADNDDRGTKETKRALKRRDKMQRIRETMGTRLEELHWLESEQRPYSEQTLANVAEQLRAALDAHVPRPYSGTAAILVNSTKAHKLLGDAAFWQRHLGGIEHEICGNSHHEVFRDQIMETARFVSRFLKPAKSGGASRPEDKQAE